MMKWKILMQNVPAGHKEFQREKLHHRQEVLTVPSASKAELAFAEIHPVDWSPALQPLQTGKKTKKYCSYGGLAQLIKPTFLFPNYLTVQSKAKQH